MRVLRRTVLALALLAPTGPGARAARLEDLPRFDPSRVFATVPGWRPDRIEIRLRADAARRAVPAGARTAPAGAAAHPLGVAAVDALAGSLGARLTAEFGDEAPGARGEPDLSAYWIARLPAGLDLAEALARFAALPEVESAAPIAVMPVSRVPGDSLFDACTWLWQPSGHDIHAPEGWDASTGDTSIVVAVLDTGVLLDHPDLGGSVAGLNGNVFVNRAERGGLPGVDDDGNGYVDDVTGWDFVALGSGAGVTPGEDWADADNDPNDFAGHGTAVAGLIGALADDGIGLPGVAWKVRILPVRVGWSALAAPLGLVDMSFVAQGIRYATRMGASVINCSFSTVLDPGLTDAASAAVRAGVTIVCAAGNGGQSQELGQRGDVLAVAAVDGSDVVASFSNQGAWVDVAAPGVALISLGLVHAAGDSIGLRQPAYATALNGTSFAAPLVSGAIAVLQGSQHHRGGRPLSAYGAILRVRDTADDIAALQPPNTSIGTGRLDLLRLLTDRNTSVAVRAGSSTVGPAVVLPHTSCSATLVHATQDQHLLFSDGTSSDTLALKNLGGRPARQLALADMGGGRGVRMYVGLRSGRMAGFDTSGNALPGFPVAGAGALYPLAAGPALGDVDGDGVLDVVSGAGDGSIYAWSADGTPLTNFPVALGGAAFSVPVALAPLDGGSAVSIVAMADDGTLHVIEGDGSERAGFPVALGTPPGAPLVARFDIGREPLIVVASGTRLTAVRPDGSIRFDVPLGGTVAQDPLLADLDGDERPEIVVPLTIPAALAAFDSAGAPLTGRGWPCAMAATASGAAVAGHLLGGARTAIVVMQGTGLVEFDDSTHAVGRFPMPGGAGLAPTLGDFDCDGAAEVDAGTGPDSTLFIYDAGAGTADPVPMWPTPRGDFARTGYVAAHPSALGVGPSPAPRTIGLALAARGCPGRPPLGMVWSGGANAPKRLELYDVSGRRVRGFALGLAGSGAQTWDGRDERGVLAPAGLYFARLICGSLHVQTRVVLLP